MTQSVNHKRSLTTSGYMLNGCLSTSVMLLALQPVNTVKTYIMAGKGMPPVNALYRGMTPIATSYMTVQAISFFTQGYLVNRFFQGNRETMSSSQKVIMSSFTAVVTSPISTFFDRIMILCQVNKEGPKATFRKIVQKGGVVSLEKGFTPSLLRDLFFATSLWAFTDIFSSSIHVRLPSHWKHRDAVSSVSGKLIAGGIAGALSTPVDVVKTRMQADTSGKYRTSLQTVSYLVSNEGYKVFFKGIVVRTSLIASSILVLGYSKEKIPNFFPDSLYQNRGKI